MTNIIAWVLKKDLFLNLTDKILSNRVTQCDEPEITLKNISFKIPSKSFNTLLIKCIIEKIKLISRRSFSDHKIGGSYNHRSQQRQQSTYNNGPIFFA